MNNHNVRRPIEITDHAMRRLRERIGGEKNAQQWGAYVKKARYDGAQIGSFTEEEMNNFRRQCRFFNHSEKITLYDGYWFVFCGNSGHSRTLKTVFKYGGNENA